MTHYVAYLRASTERQGKSGLGLEAQEAAIVAFLKPEDAIVLPKFVEVESGCRSDRPELAKAIARCRTTGAKLLIAKLDRLARNVHFVAGLTEQVDIAACDMPSAKPFEMHVRAALAEDVRRLNSARIRSGLQAAKARGVKLGGDHGYRPSAEALAHAAAARGRRADEKATARYGDVQAIRKTGVTSMNGIAVALNARGIATPRGNGTWTATAVRRVLARVEA
ncbi:MAG: recombinase family protein [Acetobacteraceae bacterium]|jgi:DNA invertase Pin-like site-specific DNA recombinase